MPYSAHHRVVEMSPFAFAALAGSPDCSRNQTMKLISRPQAFDPEEILIGGQHRVALGLESGTRVYLARLGLGSNDKLSEYRSESDDDTSAVDKGASLENKPRHQVRLTTLAQGTQSSNYRLEYTLAVDEPGSVKAVLSKLKGFNISILETETTKAGREHAVLAIIDLHKLEQEYDGNKEKVENELNRRLTSVKPGELSLNKIDPIDSEPHSGEEAGSKPVYVQGTIERGRLVCSPTDARGLFGLQPVSVTRTFPSWVLMFSDTEEKYLSMYFPAPQDCLLYLSVSHNETAGALFAFAEVFGKYNLNILDSYSRLQQAGDRAQWKAVLDITDLVKSGAGKSLSSFLGDLREVEHFVEFDEFELYYERGLEPRTPSMEPCPYRYSGELRSDELKKVFFGRQELLSPIVGIHVLESGKLDDNFLISGYYKTGKSCLLHQVQALIEDHNERSDGSSRGILALRVDALGLEDNDFLLSVLWRLYERLAEDTNGHTRESAREASGLALVIESMSSSQPETLNGLFDEIPDLPSDLGLKREVIMKSLRGDYELPGVQLRRAYEKGINRAIDRHSYTSIVVLVDEAQEILSLAATGYRCPERPESSVALYGLHARWLYLMNSFPMMRWVLASSKDWCDPSTPMSGLLTKTRTMELRPLSHEAARELIVTPFKKMKPSITVSDKAVQAIINETGRQPCYIQAFCRVIYDSLCSAPGGIDVVNRELVRGAIPRVLSELHRHFRGMYSDLSGALGPDVIRELLGIEKGDSWKDLRDLLKKPQRGDSEYSLGAVPGLLVEDKLEQRSNTLVQSRRRTRTQCVANPLFRRWAIENGMPVGGGESREMAEVGKPSVEE